MQCHKTSTYSLDSPQFCVKLPQSKTISLLYIIITTTKSLTIPLKCTQCQLGLLSNMLDVFTIDVYTVLCQKFFLIEQLAIYVKHRSQCMLLSIALFMYSPDVDTVWY